jgi:hypothetical protein
MNGNLPALCQNPTSLLHNTLHHLKRRNSQVLPRRIGVPDTFRDDFLFGIREAGAGSELVAAVRVFAVLGQLPTPKETRVSLRLRLKIELGTHVEQMVNPGLLELLQQSKLLDDPRTRPRQRQHIIGNPCRKQPRKCRRVARVSLAARRPPAVIRAN